MSAALAPGTRWHRKRPGGVHHGGDLVFVIKVIGNNVQFRERAVERGYSRMPVGLFLGTFEPEPTAACQRCGSLRVKEGSRYCVDCLSLICRVRNAKRKKESEVVLTTTDNSVIEQRHQDEPKPVVRKVVDSAERGEDRAVHWRITGRRVIVQEQTVEVVGANVIDALAAVEAQAPGLDVTDVHLLD